jgi:glucose uptake protein
LQSALLLLVLGFVCLGSWANLFRSSKWRYELFYFDFALGALIASLIAAFTCGTFGSEMSFIDSTVVAGLTSQATAFAAGFVFGLGNLLLLGGVALAGMAAAFPLAFSVAFIIPQALHLNRTSLLSSSLILLFYLIAAIALVIATHRRVLAQPVSSPAPKKAPKPASTGQGLKAVAVCILAGILLGISEPLGASAFWGDLGLGPYASTLLFSSGLAAATLLFNIFLMNIGLLGRVTLPSYLQGTRRHHVLGALGGAVWASGLLLSLLGRSVPLPEWTVCLVQGWILLPVVWGVVRWKEFARTPKAGTLNLWIGCAAIAGALIVASILPHG